MIFSADLANSSNHPCLSSRVSGCSARRVGNEDSAQTQGHAAARAYGEDGVTAIDASGDTGAAKAASHQRRAPRGHRSAVVAPAEQRRIGEVTVERWAEEASELAALGGKMWLAHGCHRFTGSLHARARHNHCSGPC
jgi:hypothetical protein